MDFSVFRVNFLFDCNIIKYFRAMTNYISTHAFEKCPIHNRIIDLRVCAEEVHLCGSPSFLPIVRRLCEKTRDELTVHEYDRLAPLVVSDTPLASFSHVKVFCNNMIKNNTCHHYHCLHYFYHCYLFQTFIYHKYW